MGTSASNLGPKAKSDLLPTWYEDLLDSTESDQSIDFLPSDITQAGEAPTTTDSNESGNWGATKRTFSRALGGTGRPKFKNAAKSYVKTLGGAKKASKGAKRGIIVMSGLASFLGNASSNGLREALIEIGLSDCIGQSSEVLLIKLVDKLSPVGNTLDDAIAREAMITTLDELYTKAAENGDDESILEQLTTTSLSDATITFVSNFIFTKWIHELGIVVENKLIPESEAIKIEKEMKEFIHAEVQLGIGSIPPEKLDLNNSISRQIIEGIFQIAYSTLAA